MDGQRYATSMHRANSTFFVNDMTRECQRVTTTMATDTENRLPVAKPLSNEHLSTPLSLQVIVIFRQQSSVDIWPLAGVSP